MFLATFSQEPLFYIVGGVLTLGIGYLVLFYFTFFFCALLEGLFGLKVYKPDPALLHEIEYGDYITWAAKNGKVPYFHKGEFKDTEIKK